VVAVVGDLALRVLLGEEDLRKVSTFPITTEHHRQWVKMAEMEKKLSGIY
jgi:hypothetical protein